MMSKGLLACGGAAGPLRWKPVTHSLAREAQPQSAPFTAPVYTHTRTQMYTDIQVLKHTHTHTLKCQQTRSYTHAQCASTLRLEKHT